MIKGFDIDGVITAGIVPTVDGVIITGRSWEESPETYKMLRDKGIFNAVYFNPNVFGGKTIENSARWKAQMIKQLGLSMFYEDDMRQLRVIKNLCSTDVIIIHVTDMWIKENVTK